MWSVQDPILPPTVLTLEEKLWLETADECQWNVLKVCWKIDFWVSLPILMLWDCGSGWLPPQSISVWQGSNCSVILIKKKKRWFVDQCCSQDHLNQDRVITKTNFKQYNTSLDNNAWLWWRLVKRVWSWLLESPDYAPLKATKSFNWPTRVHQVCLFHRPVVIGYWCIICTQLHLQWTSIIAPDMVDRRFGTRLQTPPHFIFHIDLRCLSLKSPDSRTIPH